jgi:ParB family chromosome partitioning protein
MEVPVNEIVVPSNYRGKLRDIAKLVVSIEKNGLLHPVVLDSNHALVAGRRRLEAVKRLGWKTVPATVLDIKDAVEAALAENTCRLSFQPSEVWALVKRMREQIKPGRPKDGEARQHKKTVEIIAPYFNLSPTNLERMGRVLESGNEEVIASLDRGVSVLKCLNKLGRKQREEERESHNVPPDEQYPILHCDFRQLPVEPKSARLILTDPPWGAEGLALISDFVTFADKVLADDGLIGLYPGNFQLPDWCEALRKRFEYVWTGVVVYAQAKDDKVVLNIHRRKKSDVLIAHTPVLIFSRPGWKGRLNGTVVVPPSWAEEKRWHNWVQSSQGMAHWLCYLSNPGDLVVEPFCGGGTVPFVCKQRKRRCIACDVDETAVMASRKRLESVREP